MIKKRGRLKEAVRKTTQKQLLHSRKEISNKENSLNSITKDAQKDSYPVIGGFNKEEHQDNHSGR